MILLVAEQEVIYQVENYFRGDTEFGGGRGGAEGELCEEVSHLIIGLDVLTLSHFVKEQHCDVLHSNIRLVLRRLYDFLMLILLQRMRW